MIREKTPETLTDIEPAILGKQIMRSFYISFALSQGLVVPQVKMLKLSSSYYQSLHGRETVVAASETISPDLIENLNLPRQHKSVDSDNDSQLAMEFKNRWKDYHKQLNKNQRSYNPEASGYQTKLATLAVDIAHRDLEFIAPKGEEINPNQLGRGRANKKDPFKSFFRDHLLVAKSTGDPNAFDPILADAANLMAPTKELNLNAKVQLRGLQNNLMPRLARAWQNAHPGREFDDAEEITNPANLRAARLAVDLTK